MRIFRDVELVEQLGSGMRRMLDAYSPDIFRYTETFFHVVFRYPEEPFGAIAKGGPKTQKVVQNRVVQKLLRVDQSRLKVDQSKVDQSRPKVDSKIGRLRPRRLSSASRFSSFSPPIPTRQHAP